MVARNIPPTPEQVLIEAARQYARKTAGRGLQRIALTLDDGSKRKIDVSASVVSAVDDWPPDIGWAYRGDDFSFNGHTFKAAGKTAKILRVLIDAESQPIPAAELKAIVWDSYTDDRTVQNGVSKLRIMLKGELEEFESTDPIEVSEAGYRLVAK